MIYTDKKHLTADTAKELIDFVADNFPEEQVDYNSENHFYYPVSPEQALAAIGLGAKAVSTEEILELAEKCN